MTIQAAHISAETTTLIANEIDVDDEPFASDEDNETVVDDEPRLFLHLLIIALFILRLEQK